MKAISPREAEHQFGRLIDTARAEPVVVEKHGRPVVVVVAVEEYERLMKIERGQPEAGGSLAENRRTGEE